MFLILWRERHRELGNLRQPHRCWLYLQQAVQDLTFVLSASDKATFSGRSASAFFSVTGNKQLTISTEGSPAWNLPNIPNDYFAFPCPINLCILHFQTLVSYLPHASLCFPCSGIQRQWRLDGRDWVSFLTPLPFSQKQSVSYIYDTLAYTLLHHFTACTPCGYPQLFPRHWPCPFPECILLSILLQSF